MKKFIRYISAAVLLIGIAACSEGINAPETPVIEEGVTLTIMSSAPQTRTMAGVQDLNENKIVSLHYFLYPENPSDPTADNTEVDPKHWGKITGLNSQNQQMIRLNLTEYELNYEVFPRPYTSCDVYVIANLPESIDVEALADRKLSTLKQLALEADFASNLTQENFVMEGMAQATIIDRKNIIAATGTIPVDRVASKVSVNVRVVESLTPTDGEIEVNGKTWTSEPENMTIELVNGVSNAVLGADPAGLELSYFRTAKEQRAFTENTENGTWVCDPFYSYPSAWNIGDDNEPYLRISMPWYTIIDTPIGGVEPPVTVYRNCYYKVILGGDQLKRNTWYDLTIDIGVLGSFDEQEEVLLPLSDVTYYVADWFDGLKVESEILGGRYLVVERESYEVFNQDIIEIPVTTSHKLAITNLSATYPDLSSSSGGTKNDTDVTVAISDDWSNIVINNKLDNNLYSETFNFAPITITFTVFQDDDGDGVKDANEIYSKEITVVQYPAIYGKLEVNSDYNDGSSTTDKHGYAFVNGYYGRPGNGINQTVEDFCAVSGSPSGSGVNSNSMFVITATSLEGTDYIIGDPRTMAIDTELIERYNWADSKALYGTTPRELQYYYPAQSDLSLGENHPTYNMIAPKFRICSGYGAINNDFGNRRYLAYMEGRCASYQEDGYPAGRWRLPTKAELEFVNVLSEKGLLPNLFAEIPYWCAHGYGQYTGQQFIPVPSDDFGDTDVSVRCVYDEWYWENSDNARLTDKETFTWGDMPRENFQ